MGRRETHEYVVTFTYKASSRFIVRASSEDAAGDIAHLELSDVYGRDVTIDKVEQMCTS